MAEHPEQAADANDGWLLDDDDAKAGAATVPTKHPWKVLIVDDEKDVHTATRLAIKDIHFRDKGLALLYASSGAEGFEVLKANPDVALILLDVVM